jgi:hypothetical protein
VDLIPLQTKKSLLRRKSDISSLLQPSYPMMILNFIRSKLKLDLDSFPSLTLSFKDFLVHTFQSEFRVQTQTLKHIAKILNDAQDGLEDISSLTLSLGIKYLCTDHFSAIQEHSLLKLILELSGEPTAAQKAVLK